MRHFPNRDLFDWHILCKCAVKFGETTRDSHFFSVINDVRTVIK